MTAASKIALVTGGSRGLGRNMAPRPARDGKGIILTCIVAFLASEDSHWITGQRIEASGGMFL